MTRTAFDNVSNKQVAILPSKIIQISQGPGTSKNGNSPFPNSVYNGSHQGYKAIDHCDSTDRALYAPFDMECVNHQLYGDVNSGGAYFSFFRSMNEVLCADGSISYVSFVCIHGGGNIETEGSKKTLQTGSTFTQGQKFYKQGNDGLSSDGVHVHINAKKTRFSNSDLFYFSSEMKTYNQSTLNGENAGTASGLIDDDYLENIFYRLDGDSLIFEKNSGKYFENLINFETYNDSGELNGWVADGGSWYYYENGVKASGWIKISEVSFYLDPNNGNAMLTGWFKENGSNYYFNPKTGEVGHNDKYAGGAMLTGWVFLDNAWYLFGEGGIMQTGWVWNTAYQAWYYFYTSGTVAGQMAVSTWIDSVYYVGSDGKMYKGGKFQINGVWYNFDNSGVATKA